MAVSVSSCAGASDPEAGVDTASFADELHALARSLVPPSSRVIAEVEGECVELAPSPSCVHIYFTGSRGEEDPADVLRQAARAHGWHETLAQHRAGGTWLQFERRGYDAWAVIWIDSIANPCRSGASARKCADELQVILSGS